MKRFLPLPVSFLCAYLSLLKDTDHQTNVILHKDNASKYKMQFLNDDFIYEGNKAVQTYLALHKK